ncbi:hypothetical protein ACTFIR_002869 [Dictyostelium discoideum]
MGRYDSFSSFYQTAAFLAKDERFVLDYRELNNQTVEFSYPMPDAEAILTKTGKAKIYSKIDFKAGFHQLNLETSSRDKIAFSLGGSLYEFIRAPFGMKNSPAYFNRWVQDVIREFKDFAEGYVDGIIVFSKLVEEHIGHLNLLLTKLRANKISYSTTERELLALIVILKKFEYLLIGRKFIVYTDHLNLVHFQTMKEPSPKLIRWMDLINRFKMEVRHIDGDKNIVADMLSRDSRFEVDWDDKFLDKVRISYKDATGKDLEWLKVMKQRDDVQECNGILYLLDGSTENKRLILINKDQITKVLDEAHSTSYAGVVRLQTKLRASYYFQSFSLKVKKYVQSCAECRKNRIEQEKHGLLHPLPVPIRPWDDVSMDFMNLPNTENGFDSVYVVVGRLSKVVKIIPCKRTITSIEVAKLFWDNIVCNIGLPLTIVCDNYKLFTAEIWSQMLDEAGVIMKTTVPGRAQADGQTERTNRTIKEMLIKMTQNQCSRTFEE